MAAAYYVRGYHGTSLAMAQAIVAQQTITISSNDYDWLGRGAYFFQDAPLQAWKWAVHGSASSAAAGDTPAVISANLKIDTHCFDLLDLRNWRHVLRAHARYGSSFTASAAAVPTQRPPVVRGPNGTRFHVASPTPPTSARSGNNFVDCAVIRLAVRAVGQTKGRVQSVRGSFVQGQQLYDQSYFFDHSHVQIAVLDPDTVATSFVLEDSQVLAQHYALSAMTPWPV